MLLTVVTSTASADEFQSGLDAFRDKDYATAMAAWMPLAESGDLNAMYNVGLLYDEGLGVPVDKQRAIDWYLVPAQEGDVSAQFNIADDSEWHHILSVMDRQGNVTTSYYDGVQAATEAWGRGAGDGDR